MRMADEDYGLAEAERRLKYAHHILTYSSLASFQPEEWMLLASLVGEADLAIRTAPEEYSLALKPVLETVVALFRAETDGFRNIEFQRHARAARRQYRDLFRIG